MQGAIIKSSWKRKSFKKKPLDLFNKTGEDKVNVAKDKRIKIEVKIQENPSLKSVTHPTSNNPLNDKLTRRANPLTIKIAQVILKILERQNPPNLVLTATKTHRIVKEVINPKR